MKSANFTTTLPRDLLLWLDKTQKELNINKNSIIIEALKNWRKTYLSNKIKESYKNASLDQNWREITEEDNNYWLI